MILFLTWRARQALQSIGRGLVGTELSVEELQHASVGRVGDPDGSVCIHRHADWVFELVQGSASNARREDWCAEDALGCRSSRPCRAVPKSRFRFGFVFHGVSWSFFNLNQ